MIIWISIYIVEKKNLIFSSSGFIQEFNNKYNIIIIFKFYN